jgi:hypothetical protein
LTIYHKNLDVDINIYTKSHKNRAVDPPTLAPREIRQHRSRLGKVGVVAEGGTPAGATPGRAPPRSAAAALPQGHQCRCRCLSCLVQSPSPPGLGCAAATRPLRECRRRSFQRERRRRSPSSGRHRRWPRDCRCSHARENHRRRSLARGNRRPAKT